MESITRVVGKGERWPKLNRDVADANPRRPRRGRRRLLDQTQGPRSAGWTGQAGRTRRATLVERGGPGDCVPEWTAGAFTMSASVTFSGRRTDGRRPAGRACR
ncbi:hypothetical protein GCM10010398_07990 [Streptomyces fimbriatus]